MKRFLNPLALSLVLFAGSDIAIAATKAVTGSTARVVLETGTGTILVASSSGLGFGKATTPAKNTGHPTPTPVDIRFNAEPQSEGMARAIAYLGGKGAAIDASLKLLDFNYAVKQEISLGNSAIVELELPGANAANAKQPVTFRMRLQPSQLNVQPGGTTVAPESAVKSKVALSSNFRVSINGVAEPNVVQVLPAVVKRVGKELQITGLGVALPQTDALSGDWQKWAGLALAGGEQPEKALRIEYLDPSLKTVLLTLDFSDVGIVSMDMPDYDGNSDNALRVTFGMSARGVSIK
jgi:hypothetical protein